MIVPPGCRSRRRLTAARCQRRGAKRRQRLWGFGPPRRGFWTNGALWRSVTSRRNMHSGECASGPAAINAPAGRLGTAGCPGMIAGMAIQFARARYVSRASGGNAVRSAAYNAREAIEAERTGEVFYFRHRDAPEHHEVLLPEGAAEQFRDSAVLWNTAELAEKRRDAQVAREIVVALPADAGITGEDRIEIGAVVCRAAFCRQGAGGAARRACPTRGRGRSGAGQLARASVDHDPAARRRPVQRQKGAGPRPRGAGGPAGGRSSPTARPGASCGGTTRTAISVSTGSTSRSTRPRHIRRRISARCGCGWRGRRSSNAPSRSAGRTRPRRVTPTRC